MDLNQVTLPSTDLSRAVEFYALLGLRLIVDSRPEYLRFECPEGRSTLSIQRHNSLPKRSQTAIYFEVPDLEATVQSLQAQGLVFTTPATDTPWLWKEAHLLDPDNNRLVLFHAGVNRTHPPWRIP